MNKISHASASFLQMQACQWSQPGVEIESKKLVRFSERLVDIYHSQNLSCAGCLASSGFDSNEGATDDFMESRGQPPERIGRLRISLLNY